MRSSGEVNGEGGVRRVMLLHQENPESEN